MKNEGKSFEFMFIRILFSLKAICPHIHLCLLTNSQKSTFFFLFLVVNFLQLIYDPPNYPKNRSFLSRHLFELYDKKKGTFY